MAVIRDVKEANRARRRSGVVIQAFPTLIAPTASSVQSAALEASKGAQRALEAAVPVDIHGGRMFSGIALAAGANTFIHGLGRVPTGIIPTNGAVPVMSGANASDCVLTAASAGTFNFWMF